MGTNPPDDPSERHGSPHHLQGFSELTLRDKGDIALSIDTSRTGYSAWWVASFVDSSLIRDGVGEGDVNSLTLTQTHIKLAI
ncbi:hypothetical protein ES703_80275 [subsurface metagenome]